MKLVELGHINLDHRSNLTNSIVVSNYGHYAIILGEKVLIFTLLSSSIGYISKNAAPPTEQTFLKTPAHFPTSKAGQSTEQEAFLTPGDLSEVTLNVHLMPNVSWLSPVTPITTKVSWGPIGLLQGGLCPLAVLTDAGHVSIWEQRFDMFEMFNVSDLIYDLIKEQLHKLSDQKNYMDKLRNNCDKLFTSCIEWCDIKHNDETYFVNVQNNGDVYIWKLISFKTSTFELKIHHKFNCKMKNVNFIKWVTSNDKTFTLFLSNSKGLIQAFKINIENEMTVLKNGILWSDEDKISVDLMLQTKFKKSDYYYLIIVKKTFVICMIMDHDYNIKNTCFENVGNIHVTGLISLKNLNFLVSTLTGEIFKLNISTNKLHPVLKLEKVECDIKFTHWALYSLNSSPNKVFYLFLTTPCRKVNKTFGKTISKLYFGYDKYINLATELFDNHEQSLLNKCDYLDLARIISFKNKSIKNWHISLDDDSTVYQMKLFLWSQHTLDQVENRIPVLKENMIKVLIYEHVKSKLEYYLNLSDDFRLNDFQLKSITLYMKYINNYDGQINMTLPANLILKVFKAFEPQLPELEEVLCEWCGEEIRTIWCSQKHPRQWCSISLQEITGSDCLKCTNCGFLAHPLLISELPICIFCDMYFQKQYNVK